MKKVYLLLRNNHERGPFTVDELLQQHLRPTDLVWVEGISQAWSYPSEVPELKTYFSGAPYTLPSVHYQITDASSNDDIELRAEEIRQKILSFTPKYYTAPMQPPKPLSSTAQPIHHEEEIEFIDHRKKETYAFEWMSAAMVTLLVVAGVYGGQKYILAKRHQNNSVVTRTVNADTHAAKSFPTKPVNKVVIDSVAAVDTTTLAIDSLLASPKHDYSASIKPHKIKDSAKTVVVKDSSNNHVAATEVAPPILQEPEPKAMEPEKKDTVVQQPEEKKKSLGQVLKGLFKKKKKNQEQPEPGNPVDTSHHE